jgi:1-aminocyclopropane-1-carboxylate deaminase
MMNIISEKCRIEHLLNFYNFPVIVDVLRLDLVHPVVSGNKWFKLKKYISEATHNAREILVTFGGAYSNHIVATAAAAKLNNFKSVGIIRGEEPKDLSYSLLEALRFGMELFFVSREDYKNKFIPDDIFEKYHQNNLYVIPEGGYGKPGASGAEAILSENETKSYSHILCAVGTGTTLAGMTTAAKPGQNIIGIPVLKNNFSLQHEIENILSEENKNHFTLMHNYHFGGYAKHTEELLHFMNKFYESTGIPTDFVYTAKAFYAAFDLVDQGYFAQTDKLLLIHTGGLQGNRSLKKGTLIFG